MVQALITAPAGSVVPPQSMVIGGEVLGGEREELTAAEGTLRAEEYSEVHHAFVLRIMVDPTVRQLKLLA